MGIRFDVLKGESFYIPFKEKSFLSVEALEDIVKNKTFNKEVMKLNKKYIDTNQSLYMFLISNQGNIVNDNQTISYSNIRLMNELNFLLHIYNEPNSDVTWFNETSISL
jgi:hypothetical protein